MTRASHLIAVMACGLLGGLPAPSTAVAQNRAVVEAEFERLRRTLGISQMSAAVAEGGTVVWVRHFGTAARRGDVVRYPIASLTKPFTTALGFRLVEQEKLSLETSVDRGDGGRASVGQLLSHTAGGTAGTRFVYSSDLFRQLEAPLERAAGLSLAQALTSLVLRPAGLRHTEVGDAVSPSSGLVSTVEDMARFASALEGGRIVSRAMLGEMFRAPRDDRGRPFPYAHGWFVQQIAGQQTRWHFGQQADASSILITLPGRRLTLVVLARGDRLSSPFWLQFGDVRWSPVALAFLTQWAKLRVDLPEARPVMTEALVALATNQQARGATLAARAASLAPALVNAPDLTLLAAFARSGERALREMGRTIARRALAADAGHPRALLDLAVLNLQDGQPLEAKKLIRQLLDGHQGTPEIEALARQLLKEVN